MNEMGFYLAHEQALYEDDIESGAIFFTRPKMAEIIELLSYSRPLSPRPYDAIFIDDISRIARNLAFSLLFVQGLRFHGIQLFDARGQEYTSEHGYYYMLLLGLGAEIERDSISKRTSRGMHAAAKRMSLSARVFGFRPVSKDVGGKYPVYD